ncbi:sodium:proton antiporter [Prochlorococcus marinus XMU1414]|uniref:Cation:proton antiporter n=1 Tax=Prochlorococcus marinus XMU1424 TaxID=2774497 RepID=A0A9D9G3I0_PROMR|nr:cation:proton antiporter [Prochlorococcus marinus]MBO8227762.1 sodium:proton antiporter [Prochlorococcus marinus XMU1414]MBW3045274.1 sodium:proton antiporter [Prochlorococcus marinus str. MU1414]MCR8532459.1 cation:proton antiporter [Prochlorococcus marinus XMU1420]MCR8536843.1 cation:proton antiporter [Prochlorococcus marinus XMU1424]
MTPERLGLLWGITVFAGACARLFSSLTGFPSVVILLLSGLFIGRSGLGLVEPLDLGQGLETIVGLLVCLVLFEGGLNLKLPEGNIRNTVLKISLVRLFISLPAGIFIAHWLAGLSWQVAGIYSAIVLATGPTVVSPLVEQIKLASPLSEVLKAEGLLLEPIGAVLALLLLELTLGDLRGINDVFIALMQRLGGGVLIGLSAGWLLSEILKKIKNEASFGIELQVTLGFIFLVYGICEYFLPESGLPASVAAGFIVGKREVIDKERLDNLIGELAQLAITVLFPLLAADVSWGELSPLGWGGVICVFMLMVIVRPISIWIATRGKELNLKEKIFLAWLAPRGIVTAAVASLFSIRLEQAGILGAGRLQGLVFLTILMTVGIQGLSAKPLANRLELGQKNNLN